MTLEDGVENAAVISVSGTLAAQPVVSVRFIAAVVLGIELLANLTEVRIPARSISTIERIRHELGSVQARGGAREEARPLLGFEISSAAGSGRQMDKQRYQGIGSSNGQRNSASGARDSSVPCWASRCRARHRRKFAADLASEPSRSALRDLTVRSGRRGRGRSARHLLVQHVEHPAAKMPRIAPHSTTIAGVMRRREIHCVVRRLQPLSE